MTATDAERKARHRAKAAAKGLKRVEVNVPAERDDEIREIARQMREGER